MPLLLHSLKVDHRKGKFHPAHSYTDVQGTRDHRMAWWVRKLCELNAMAFTINRSQLSLKTLGVSRETGALVQSYDLNLRTYGALKLFMIPSCLWSHSMLGFPVNLLTICKVSVCDVDNDILQFSFWEKVILTYFTYDDFRNPHNFQTFCIRTQQQKVVPIKTSLELKK